MDLSIRLYNGMLYLSTPKYVASYVSKIKELPSRKWEPNARAWIVPVSLLNDVINLGLPLKWDTPLEEIKQFNSSVYNLIEIDDELRSAIKLDPYPYQWVGGAGFLPRIGNGLLADEMGLGKIA